MKFRTKNQNRPKTPNGIISAIERKLATMQIVIRKIWYCNAGWGISYVYGSSSNIAPKDRLFKESVVFTYYKTIEECLKSEYDRIVLGINIKGSGLLEKGKSNIGSHHMFDVPNTEIKAMVTAVMYNGNGEAVYKKMTRSLAEHWGLQILSDNQNHVIFIVDGKTKKYLQNNHVTDIIDKATRYTKADAQGLVDSINKKDLNYSIEKVD